MAGRKHSGEEAFPTPTGMGDADGLGGTSGAVARDEPRPRAARRRAQPARSTRLASGGAGARQNPPAARRSV